MSRVVRYKGDAFITYKNIKSTVMSYTVNKVYKNNEYDIYWYINQNGYMHILRPCNVRLNGKHTYYTIEDYLLTIDNMLESKGHIGEYETIECVFDKLKKLIEQ